MHHQILRTKIICFLSMCACLLSGIPFTAASVANTPIYADITQSSQTQSMYGFTFFTDTSGNVSVTDHTGLFKPMTSASTVDHVSGQLLLPASAGSSVKIAATNTENLLGNLLPAVYMYPIANLEYQNPSNPSEWTGSISVSDLRLLCLRQEETEEHILPDLMKKIPNGTRPKQAFALLSDYIADKLSYDYSATTYDTLHPYQSGTMWYSSNLGVCTTYASVFAALSRMIPFTSAGYVNWSYQNTHFVKTYLLNSNGIHAFNRIDYGGRSHYYDLTWYDNNDGVRDPAYLDMAARYLTDSVHSNAHISYPERTDKMSDYIADIQLVASNANN